MVLGGVPVIVGGCELTTATLKVWMAARPSESVAVIVMESVPVSAVVGVHEIAPVALLIERLLMDGVDVTVKVIVLPCGSVATAVYGYATLTPLFNGGVDVLTGGLPGGVLETTSV